MAAVITWKVEQMNCYPSAEGETDVVFTVYWRCNGEETTETDTYYGTSYGSTNVEYKEGQPFTPYADLTEDQVLNWVWAAPDFDKDKVESSVQEQINDKINPPIVTLALPWS